jgi:hypothetical protein
MADDLAVARKSSSFDLVEKEMNHTIELAEASLDRFQENRDSGEDLQNCVSLLNQLRGIFTLIELQGGTIICEEAIAVIDEISMTTAEDQNVLLASLSQALFILRRYTEYFNRRREDHPELLLDIINRLRGLRNDKPLPDSYFFHVTIEAATPRPVLDTQVDAEVFQFRSRRLRHMFQVGLLNLLRTTEQQVAFQLISRAASGFLKLCNGSSLAELWELTKKTSEVMLKHHMSITVARQHLFMRIEKYAKELAKQGTMAAAEFASEALLRELIYIIAISSDQEEDTRILLARYDTQPTDFDESKKEAHLSLLMGPGSDVLSSLAKALHEEINQIKDKLDIIERGIDTEENSFEQIGIGLNQLADTLMMLDLSKLSGVARQLQTKLKGWSLDNRQPTDNDLLAIADSVLSIEQAVYKLEEEGLTVETDRLAGRKTSLDQSPYLTEAMIVVLGESQNSISLAKRSITAYLESEGDGLHLDNVLSGLAAVTGALLMIGQSRAAKALSATAKFIEDKLVNADVEPDEHSLDTLADALTSLEYYTDSLNRSSVGNVELLMLAEESVKSLGYS